MPPQEQETRTTTLSVSPMFAKIITSLAKAEKVSAKVWCDKYLAPGLKAKAKKAIRQNLQAVDLGGEG